MKEDSLSEEMEEYLKARYRKKEKGEKAKVLTIEHEQGIKPASVSEMLKKLEKKGLLIYKPYYGAKLTKKGRKIGEKVTRKHRLIERFLGLIGIKRKVHEKACVLEHAIPDDVEKGIKKLLMQKGVPLANLRVGTKTRILGIMTDKKSAQRLKDMGLTKGTPITITKAAPFKGPIELSVRGTRLAVGRKLSARIFVK